MLYDITQYILISVVDYVGCKCKFPYVGGDQVLKDPRFSSFLHCHLSCFLTNYLSESSQHLYNNGRKAVSTKPGSVKFKHTLVIRYPIRRYKITDDNLHHTAEAAHKGRRDCIFSHERRAITCSQDKYYCEPRRLRFVTAARLAFNDDKEGAEAESGTGAVKRRRLLVEKFW